MVMALGHCVGETKGELDGHQIRNNQPKTKEKGFVLFITFRNYLQKDKVYNEWILRTGESTKRKDYVISSEILVSKKKRDGLQE